MAIKKTAPRQTNIFAKISLILGSASFIIGVIPFLNIISSLLAIIFGFLALGKIKKGAHGKWLAITGIILGLINVLISGVILGGLFYIATH